MLEKRRSARIDVNLPVILRHRGRLLPATILNISCGGMYLETSATDVGDGGNVEVIFDLEKDHRDLSLRGQITRVETATGDAGMGVQFTNLFSQSYQAIQDYLRKNLN